MRVPPSLAWMSTSARSRWRFGSPMGDCDERTIPHEKRAVNRLVRKWKREAPGAIRCAYEAGPCGYGLQRDLTEQGIDCQVIAPSLIPRKPGERIKTDRRDARKLAELFEGGLLTEVHAPTPEDEAVRDLCRAREDAKEDELRARHRLGKFLLRRAAFVGGRRAGQWRTGSGFEDFRLEHPADQAIFEAYCIALDQTTERVRLIELAMTDWAVKEPYATPVSWLRCFHGIDTVTAMTLVTELHDFRRFRRPRELMSYLGSHPE